MTKGLPPIKLPVEYTALGTYIYDADDKMIADVRGWGWIQKLKNPEKKQDALGQFITDAINEKFARDNNIPDPTNTEELIQICTDIYYDCDTIKRLDELTDKALALLLSERNALLDEVENNLPDITFHGDSNDYFAERYNGLSPAEHDFWHEQSVWWYDNIQNASKQLEYAQRQYNIAQEKLGRVRILGNRAMMPDESREG